MQDHIFIKGARENNLKNIDVTIPRDKLVVLTGLSGSGKSSLAFDTIYAEGQRRYVESLSSYARMFLGQMDKPDVDYIDGLSPAISIDQKTTSKNPRSTVGTVTEIYDYLRLLWARVGTPHCPKCGKEIRQQTIDQIIDQIMALPEGTRIQVLAPVVRGRKGEHAKVLEDARRSGYVRVRADGNLYDLSEDIPLEKNKKHSIEIVVDRLIVRPDVGPAADGLRGDGVASVRRHRAGEPGAGGAGPDLLPELRLRRLRHQHRGADAPDVLLQQSLRRLPHLHGPGDAAEGGPGHHPPRRQPVHPGWGHRGPAGGTPSAPTASAGCILRPWRKNTASPCKPRCSQLSPEVRDVIFYGTRGEKLELHYDQPRGRGTLYQPFEGIANNLERRYQETQSDASKRGARGVHGRVPLPGAVRAAVCGRRRWR